MHEEEVENEDVEGDHHVRGKADARDEQHKRCPKKTDEAEAEHHEGNDSLVFSRKPEKK